MTQNVIRSVCETMFKILVGVVIIYVVVMFIIWLSWRADYQKPRYVRILQDPTKVPGTWERTIVLFESPFTTDQYGLVAFDEGKDFVMDYDDPNTYVGRDQRDKWLLYFEGQGYVDRDPKQYGHHYGLQTLMG